MKRLFAVMLFAFLLSGCSADQQQVQDTGRAINLAPSKSETRAGY